MTSIERFSSQPVLTTTEVAQLLDVHTSSVKRWCNSGELPFETTEGGHRRIHLMDVIELAGYRSIQTFLQPFHPYEAHVWEAVSEAVENASFDRAISLCLGWLDRGQMDRVSELLFVLGTHPQIAHTDFIDVAVRGLMARVGSDWRNGRIRSGDEHLMSNTVLETLFRLRREWAPLPERLGTNGTGRPLAIVGAMEGDQHHLGAMCVRLVLEAAGWRVRYLGPDVPIDEFANMQAAHEASLVAISLSPPLTPADAMRCARVLGELHSDDRPYALALGGAVDPSQPLPEGLPFERVGVFDAATTFADWLGTSHETEGVA